MNDITTNQSKNTEIKWMKLCKIGGVASLISVVCSLITMIVVITLGAEPSTVSEYFTLLQDNRLVGILRLDFSTVINLAFYYLMYIGLYAAVRREHNAYAVLATSLAFVGLTLWFATHSAFSMLYLSDQYAAATTSEQISQLLAAGEAIIASDMYKSTGGIMGGIFLQSAAVLISVAMLRSSNFNKKIAYIGIIGNGLDLARIVLNIFIPGNSADILMVIAGPLMLIWLLLLGLRLYKLGRLEGN